MHSQVAQNFCDKRWWLPNCPCVPAADVRAPWHVIVAYSRKMSCLHANLQTRGTGAHAGTERIWHQAKTQLIPRAAHVLWVYTPVCGSAPFSADFFLPFHPGKSETFSCAQVLHRKSTAALKLQHKWMRGQFGWGVGVTGSGFFWCSDLIFKAFSKYCTSFFKLWLLVLQLWNGWVFVCLFAHALVWFDDIWSRFWCVQSQVFWYSLSSLWYLLIASLRSLVFASSDFSINNKIWRKLKKSSFLLHLFPAYTVSLNFRFFFNSYNSDKCVPTGNCLDHSDSACFRTPPRPL